MRCFITEKIEVFVGLFQNPCTNCPSKDQRNIDKLICSLMSATRIGKRHSFVLAQNESGKISCIIFFKEVGARWSVIARSKNI